MSLQETAIQAAQAMIAAGYTPFCAWNEYKSVFAPIVRIHEKLRITQFKLNDEEKLKRLYGLK